MKRTDKEWKTIKAVLEENGVTFDEYDHAHYNDLTIDATGHMNWGIGSSGPQGHAYFFDYLALPCGYMALEMVCDSESGGFVDTLHYDIVPMDEAIVLANWYVDMAWDACYSMDVFAPRELDGEDDEEGTPGEDEAESQRMGDDFIISVTVAVNHWKENNNA